MQEESKETIGQIYPLLVPLSGLKDSIDPSTPPALDLNSQNALLFFKASSVLYIIDLMKSLDHAASAILPISISELTPYFQSKHPLKSPSIIKTGITESSKHSSVEFRPPSLKKVCVLEVAQEVYLILLLTTSMEALAFELSPEFSDKRENHILLNELIPITLQNANASTLEGDLKQRDREPIYELEIIDILLINREKPTLLCLTENALYFVDWHMKTAIRIVELDRGLQLHQLFDDHILVCLANTMYVYDFQEHQTLKQLQIQPPIRINRIKEVLVSQRGGLMIAFAKCGAIVYSLRQFELKKKIEIVRAGVIDQIYKVEMLQEERKLIKVIILLKKQPGALLMTVTWDSEDDLKVQINQIQLGERIVCLQRVKNESLVLVRKKLTCRNSLYQFEIIVKKGKSEEEEGRIGKWHELFSKSRGIDSSRLKLQK